MEKTLGTHPWITAILIEFLYFTAENYHPPLREQIYKHIGMAAQDIIDKGVIRYKGMTDAVMPINAIACYIGL